MAQFVTSNIKQPPNELLWVQQVVARVQYTTKAGREVDCWIASNIVYTNFPCSKKLIKQRIKTAKVSIKTEVERKLGIRSGLKTHRGYFIFQSYKFLDI